MEILRSIIQSDREYLNSLNPQRSELMKNGTLVLFGFSRTDMECNCLEFSIFISVCTNTGLDKQKCSV